MIALQQSDYVLNLMVASTDPQGKTMRYLQGGNVDGALVVSHHTADTFLSTLTSTIPVVFGGRPAAGIERRLRRGRRQRCGSRTGTERLISTGRKRIATITGPKSMRVGSEREAGFLAALADAGLTPGPVVEGDFTLRGGASAMRTVLEQDPTIDGIFVASDSMAAGAMTVLRSMGHTGAKGHRDGRL